MTLYEFALSLHVVTAVLGVGQVGAFLVLTLSPEPSSANGLRRLLLGIRVSTLVVLLSGALLDYAAGGAFHERWWFRLSFFGVVALGVLSGIAGRVLRRGPARSMSSLAGAMALLTACIAVLMELKPG